MTAGALLGAQFIAVLCAAILPTLRAELTLAPGPTAGLSTLQLRLEPTDLALGSYQGRLLYDAGSLSIVSISATGGGGTRMYNTADSAKGVVGFAGFTIRGFSSADALTLVVKALRPIERSGLRVVLDVAGDMNGKAVARERLISALGPRPPR